MMTHPGLLHGFDGEYVTFSMIAEYMYEQVISNKYPHTLSNSQKQSLNYLDHISYRVKETDPDAPNMYFDELAFILITKSESGESVKYYPRVVKPHIVRVRAYTVEQSKAYHEMLTKARSTKDESLMKQALSMYDSFLYSKEEIIETIIQWLETEQSYYFKTWQNSYDQKVS